MILVCFQGKPFSITVIQICTLTTDAKEAEVDWFYEDLQDHLEITPKKKKKKTKKGCPLNHRGMEYENKKSGDTRSTRQV